MFAAINCPSVCYVCCVHGRVGAQLGLAQMITVEIKIPNRMVGLGETVGKRMGGSGEGVCVCGGGGGDEER